MVRGEMRIVFDSRDAVAPDARGWGRYARELASALSSEPRVDLVRLDSGWSGVPEAAWELAGMARAARRAGADLLHAPNCFLPVRRGGLPGVVTVHDLAWERFPDDFAPLTRRKFAWWTPRAARSAEAVVVPSRCTGADLCARYGVAEERVHVVAEAPALATGGEEPPEGPYLLGVGDLRAKKNWGRLVEAWRELREAGLEHRLVIAGGDAGEACSLRAAAGRHPLELPGYVTDARLDALLRGADALVHPSLWEGFGLVVLEAQARGVPVVAARGSSLEEAGGDAAVYVDGRDVSSVAAGIEEALARREELALAGREHAARFSWERAAAETADVYEKVLGG